MFPVIAIFLRKTYFYNYMLIKQQQRDSRCQYKSRHHTRLKPSFKDIQSSEVQKVPSLIFLSQNRISRTEQCFLKSCTTAVKLRGSHFYCSFVAYVAYYFQQGPSVAVASINLRLTRGYTDSDHNIKSPSCYIAKAWVICWLTKCLTTQHILGSFSTLYKGLVFLKVNIGSTEKLYFRIKINFSTAVNHVHTN